MPGGDTNVQLEVYENEDVFFFPYLKNQEAHGKETDIGYALLVASKDLQDVFCPSSSRIVFSKLCFSDLLLYLTRQKEIKGINWSCL